MRNLHHILLLLLLAPSCHNACQALCDDIYDFAVNDCGADWTRDDLKECYKAQSLGQTDSTHRSDCRDADASVADWWDCGDIDRYFDDLLEGSQGGDTASGAMESH